MLHQDFGLELKAVSDTGALEGYGSTFGGPPDLGGDIVMPGAFIDSLAEYKRTGSMPQMFWGHDSSSLPIGNWTDMAEDGKGLWVAGQLDMDDPFASKIRGKLQKKQLRGLSIGYDVKSASPDPKRPGVRMLEKVKLWEVSIVNMPMNTRAAVDTVKSFAQSGAWPTEREFQEAMRELGFSKSRAEALTNACKPLLRGDPESKEDELVQFLKGLRA